MSAKFEAVTLADVRDFLKADKGWKEVKLPGVREHVFDWEPKRWPGCVIRVYTSISVDHSFARRKGSDAFRVCAVDIVSSKGLLKSQRVNRTTSWRTRLQAVVTEKLADMDSLLTRRREQGEWPDVGFAGFLAREKAKDSKAAIAS
jgi:hypothetical protein